MIFSDASDSANWATSALLNERGLPMITAKKREKNALIFGSGEEKKELSPPSHSHIKESGVGLSLEGVKSQNTQRTTGILPDWYKSYDHIAILGSATEGSVTGAWFRDIEVMDEDINFVKRVIFRHQTPKYYEGSMFTALMKDEAIVKGGGLNSRLGQLSWLFKMHHVLL